MSFATQILKKQKRVYFSYLWRGVVLMAVGIYAAIMISLNGMGDSVQTGGGANIPLRKLMGWLTQRGINAEQLLPYFMVGLFCIIAVIGLYNIVRGARLMAPTRTMFGKSVLGQMNSHERFSDVIDAINADMEQEPSVFGSVHIGRRWIADNEAMRLDSIRGVFWFDQAMEDHVLCCVDEAQNIWAASLRYSADRDKAAEHLKATLPDIASGDKDAYVAFLSGEPISEPQPVSAASTTITLPPNASFSFVTADGVPTSNFTYETVCEALRSLENSSGIALRVLTPGMVSEIFFVREDSRWNVGLTYQQDDKECRATKAVDEKQAADILESIMKQNRLPDFCELTGVPG